uniref:Uncharacterized protein LOC104243244 n=1 Tax=Nicotiana sylvestris TaxID=4096 RepID=A0A1U7Y0Q0_NICSY|nr:PREDICTED: uncharacterized protein LOC104243244 [Nicotiana sylvestris]
MDMQENGVELQNGDDKDLEILKVEVNGKKEATESVIKSQVERRTNPRRVNRRANKAATSSTSSADQSGNLEEKKCKRERINAEDFILPKGWMIEVRVRKNGSTSGHKDTYYIEKSTRHVCRSRMEVLRYLQSKQREQSQVQEG